MRLANWLIHGSPWADRTPWRYRVAYKMTALKPRKAS